jgi:hypothetical protein
MKKLLTIVLMSLFLISCGEEVLTQSTLSTDFTASDLQGFELNTCSQMTFEKPPVDMLFVIDNSGSSLLPSFTQIKQQIANTINTISNEFNYHIYVAPLIPLSGEVITQYPLLVSDPSSIPNIGNVNIVTPENLSLFSPASGNNDELGFQRVISLINGNRSNGIFRNNANTITVMISNGDDTEAIQTIQGNQYFNQATFTNVKNQLLSFSKKYALSHAVNNPLNAESFRFLSLVAHSTCNGWKQGSTYQLMSHNIYDYMGYSDDNSQKDSKDLCSGNYANLFNSINSSINAVIVGHKYDHWKISNAGASSIQEDDITVSKVLSDGSKVNIPTGAANGFEYLGYKTNQNTRYEPTIGEPVSGLVIKLNGNARIEYPDCIIAKTRTPTEYYGYIALPREPQADSVQVIVNGQVQPKSSTNGWGYIGWHDIKNIKVPGPTGAAITPAVNKTGYFIQLFGSAIFTNGDTISVQYKPASL